MVADICRSAANAVRVRVRVARAVQGKGGDHHGLNVSRDLIGGLRVVRKLVNGGNALRDIVLRAAVRGLGQHARGQRSQQHRQAQCQCQQAFFQVHGVFLLDAKNDWRARVDNGVRLPCVKGGGRPVRRPPYGRVAGGTVRYILLLYAFTPERSKGKEENFAEISKKSLPHRR